MARSTRDHLVSRKFRTAPTPQCLSTFDEGKRLPWETLVANSQLVAIHAALLPTEPDGVVVYFGDWTGGRAAVRGCRTSPTPELHRIQSNQIEPVSIVPTTDAFCGGQAFLADGRLLVAGGTFGWEGEHGGEHAPHYDGERACWIYLPRAEAWTKAADLNFQPGSTSQGGGRWYPTPVRSKTGMSLPPAVTLQPTTSTRPPATRGTTTTARI